MPGQAANLMHAPEKGLRPIGALSKFPRKASGKNFKWDVTSSIGDLTIGLDAGSVVPFAPDQMPYQKGQGARRFKPAGHAARMAMALSQGASVSTASASNLANQLLRTASNPGKRLISGNQEGEAGGKEGAGEQTRVSEVNYAVIEEDASAMMTRDSANYRQPVVRAMMAAIKSVIVLPKYSQAYVMLLSGNAIEDLSPLVACPRLRLLDVSFNKLQKLPDEETWSHFKRLEFLYLNDNNLQFSSVLSLSGATGVISLTLFNNPLAHHQHYRQFAANLMESCQLVDNNIVSDEELIENACFPEEYASCSPRSFLPNALFRMREYKSKDGDFERLLDGHKRAICNLYQTSSPAVIIQKAARKYLLPAYYASQRHQELLQEKAQMNAAAAAIQAVVRTFLIYIYAERDLKQLLQSNRSKRQMMAPFMPKHMLDSVDHVMRIQRGAREWVAHLRRRHRAARRITHCFRSWANLCRALEMLTFMCPYKSYHGLYVTDEALGDVFDGLVEASSGQKTPLSSTRDPNRWRKTDIHLRHFRVTPIYMLKRHDARVVRQDAGLLDHHREVDPRAQRSVCLFHFEEQSEFAYSFCLSKKRNAPSPSSCVQTPPLKSRGHYLSRELRRVTRGCLQVEGIRHKRKLKKSAIRLTWVKIRNGKELRHVIRALRLRGIRSAQEEVSAQGQAISKLTAGLRMPILCAFHVKASMAVLSLQSAWRGYHIRREGVVEATLRSNRAVLLMQRWWRTHSGLHRRLAFVQCLNTYLRGIKSDTLFIEAELYYLLVQLRPDFVVKYEEQMSNEDFRFGFDDYGSIRPFGRAAGRNGCFPLKFPQWIWVSRNRPKVVVKTASVPYDSKAAKSTPRMSPIPTPRRMTVNITSHAIDAAQVIISVLHHGNNVDAVTSPIEDPDGKAEPVHIGSVHNFQSAQEGGAVDGPSMPHLPRITLWEPEKDVRLGSLRRLIRIKFNDVVEARRRAAVLMRCTYDWRRKTFVKMFSHAMLSPRNALFSPRGDGVEDLPSLWLRRYGPQCIETRDRVKMEVLCQMLTKEVLPFDPPRPPSPELPEPSPGSLSARQPRPSRPSDDAVQRPLSARDPSRHSKLLDTTKQERGSSAPHVEPTIKAPPAAKAPGDAAFMNRQDATADERDLDDLGSILRFKVQKQVEDGELALKKIQATYKAPSGGGATARLTLLQQYEVPQFVKECRKAEEALKRNREDDDAARKEYVTHLNKQREIRHRTIAGSRQKYREKATDDMNQERATNSEQLYEQDRYRAMELLHVKNQIQRDKKRQQKKTTARDTVANFMNASSMLSRHGNKSGGKKQAEQERAHRRAQRNAVVRNGQVAKARVAAKVDRQVSKKREEIVSHRAFMKEVEEDRNRRWVGPLIDENAMAIASRERQKSRENMQDTLRKDRQLSVVCPSPDDGTQNDNRPSSRASSPDRTVKSRKRTPSPSSTVRLQNRPAAKLQPSPGAHASVASPWNTDAAPLVNPMNINHIIQSSVGFTIDDAVSIAPSFGSHTVDEPMILTPRDSRKSASSSRY